ncbi:GAF and ANTAR domain-containing protein [Actinomycetospora chiangmaiensis]|uniref:GAF and ANTAR domain-containing protein n=1 Tax=Actinomycetospora chiangmaiensis TaxID=402650 RepID=UPI0003826843|nr:GAF and ANTAR domain-containing protein [Actinomycetospora chiangmaiensis]
MHPRDLLASSARLSHELLAIIHDEPPSLDRIAAGLADAAAAAVPLPDHDVAVTLRVDRTRLVRAATTRVARELVTLEGRLGAGPTVQALDEIRVVGSGDRGPVPDAWSDAVARAGYHDVVAAPVVIAGSAAGAVTLHRRAPGDGEDDREVVALIAHQAALVVEAGRRLLQLRDAVASRDVIGQAKGILMSRYGIDAATAFGRLVEASQDMNVKLVDIARWYVTDQDGTAPAPRPS